jgi:hypothetical protein
MLADLYVKSWSVLRTVNTAYPPLFRLFGLLAVNFAESHLWDGLHNFGTAEQTGYLS